MVENLIENMHINAIIYTMCTSESRTITVNSIILITGRFKAPTIHEGTMDEEQGHGLQVRSGESVQPKPQP